MEYKIIIAISVACLAILGCKGKSDASKTQSSQPAQATSGSGPETTGTSAQAWGDAPTFRLGDDVTPLSYKVELEIDPSAESFSGKIEINVSLAKPLRTIWMHGRDLTIESAEVVSGKDKQVAEAIAIEKNHILGFRTAEPIAKGEATVVVHYKGIIVRRDGQGVFSEKEGENWYQYTQFESLYARMAFPCFDEPRWKTPWALSLRVDRDQVAVANTPVASETDEGNGKKLVVFETTKKLPSYLVAFAVGAFDFVEVGKSKNGVPMRIVTPKGRGNEAAYAAKVTPEILGQLEKYFGRPFPYRKFDTLIIPSTQGFGAMEHPGLITFTSRLVLWKPEQSTYRRKRSFALVQVHELGHQWFGNLVTMPWWDDIWLNEAFASWIENRVLASWRPDWQLEAVAMDSKERAMTADLLASARKIREPIKIEGDIRAAFDRITYQKGESVINMFETWLGPKVWQKGIQTYLGKYEWATATADDLLRVLGEVSGKDVATPFNTFLEQNGIPQLSFKLSCAQGKAPTVEISQSRYLAIGSKASSARKWQLPVCMTFEGGSHCMLLTEKKATATLGKNSLGKNSLGKNSLGKNSLKCPSWLNPNKNGVGYYRSLLDEKGRNALLTVAAKKLSLAEQLSYIGDIRAMLGSGAIDTKEALAVVSALASVSANDKSTPVHSAIIRLAYIIRDAAGDDPTRQVFYTRILKIFAPSAKWLGTRPRRGEPPQVAALRAKVIGLLAEAGDQTSIDAAKKAVGAYLDNKQPLDAELADAFLGIAARNSGEDALNKMIAKLKSTDNRIEQESLLYALGQFLPPELAKKAFEFALSDAVDTRDGIDVFSGAAKFEKTLPFALGFVFSNFGKLSKEMSESQLIRLPGLFDRACDKATRNKMAAFFSDKIGKLPSGEQKLKQTIEEIDLCIAYRAAQKKSLAAALNVSDSKTN